MSDLRPEGDAPATADLVLRSFRAVMDGPNFCWDLFLVDASDEDGDPLELPEWLDMYEEPAARAQGGAPALAVKQNLDDHVYVTAHRVVAQGGLELWLEDRPAALRWVRLAARDQRAELLWCVRVEGGPELATPIATAWLQRNEIKVGAAQLSLVSAKSRPKLAPAPPLPPEIDDEGREHDDEPPAARKRR